MSDEPSLEPPRGLSPLGTNVMIGVLALDCGDSYCVVVVLVGASCQSPSSQRQAAQDVRFILDHIGID